MFRRHIFQKRNQHTDSKHISWREELTQHIQKEINTERFFIGLDVSTSKTGYAIMTNQGKTLSVGILQGNKNKDLLITGKEMSERLENIIQEITQSNVHKCILGIEDSVEQYASGRTSARALFSLTRINTILSYSWFLRTGNLPIRSPVISIRAALGINNQDVSQETFNLWKQNRKTNRYHHLETKMRAFDLAKPMFPPDFNYLKTPRGLFSEENFDVADAVLVSLHTWMSYTAKQLESTSTFESFVETKKKGSKTFEKQLIHLQDKYNIENPVVALRKESHLYDKLVQKFKEQVRKEMRQQIAPPCSTP
eukprot:gb/GECH01011257.1/.p1 GENE.gb/GECH01011257.1/~~gb/GECH01011257.1/.p1  ORF type:complete len:310 (+),score=64.33 gb/GECH01011257.1/:1-930(+)